MHPIHVALKAFVKYGSAECERLEEATFGSGGSCLGRPNPAAHYPRATAMTDFAKIGTRPMRCNS